MTNIEKQRILRVLRVGTVVAMAMVWLAGCKPKTASQKVEDAAEDAAHEIKQGTERTGENIKDATEK